MTRRGTNFQTSMVLFSFCRRKNPSLGFKIKRTKNKQFFSGFRMEDHGGESAKNLAGKGNYFAAGNEFMALSKCFECELYSPTRIFDRFSRL